MRRDFVKERILGCLKGIATGDAIGKQTEMLCARRRRPLVSQRHPWIRRSARRCHPPLCRQQQARVGDR